MHSLDVIVRRNDEAAGREAGHAAMDAEARGEYSAPATTAPYRADGVTAAFSRGFLRGVVEAHANGQPRPRGVK
jgi:hypothetical protein